jgi:hypothetical protein
MTYEEFNQLRMRMRAENEKAAVLFVARTRAALRNILARHRHGLR